MNVKSLLYFLWICVFLGVDGRRQLWGEITTNIIGREDIRKYGFWLLSREAIVAFPTVSVIRLKLNALLSESMIFFYSSKKGI